MAELFVSKKSIKTLLSGMQGKKFIIPDFQRPYKWDEEKCETLWNDIVTFKEENTDTTTEYFLGTIVTNQNDNGCPDVIDGQQRITSFFLLLRAFYKMLDGMAEDDQVVGLKSQVAPCLWDIDSISQKVTDKSLRHIESQVATADDNDVFHSILETGDCIIGAVDNYSKNYVFFLGKCREFARENPLQWKQLCVTILNRCIILPIECNTQETALTIFSTLNDRGLPLSDSDIFKAQIYRNLKTKEERTAFTETWKELTEICTQSFVTIDDVFRYYSHILRARNNDKSKEVGLRKFYADNKYSRLKAVNLIEEIMDLAKFWRSVNTEIPPDDDAGYIISTEASKYLHCLYNYPNEFWKYPTSVFFMKNKCNQSFDIDFCLFLKKMTAFLFAKFLDAPTVNAIKDDIYAACISIQSRNEFSIDFELNDNLLSQQIDNHSSSRISRALLLLDAYLNPKQKELIPFRFEIEHIFPKKWQDTNYNGWSLDDAQLYLDRFGNKIVFEKKLNIQAGNGYFGVKKLRYSASKIASVLDLSVYPKNDWVKTDIEERETSFKSTLITFFKNQLN
ncbi:MAG TPA: DUF262 domain-containing HNH endonuclease family protein [Hanamia sp.]|nr:DUF262 domain-containing HNH endonuclease family protein [Hanamia sp.]